MECRAIRREFPFFKRSQSIKKFMAMEECSKHIVVKNGLGHDLANPGRRSRGINLNLCRRTAGHHPGAGFRGPGGGRKNKFLKIWERVKAWHTIQRLKVETVDQQDIWLNLEDQMMLEIEVLKYLQNRRVLKPNKVLWLHEIEDRLKKLRESKNYREVYLLRLQSWAGMSSGKPQRRSSMSLAQEKLGWEVSMNSWDRAIWLAAFGTAKDLQGQISVPEEFIKQRKQVVIVASDQVPIWIARQGAAARTVFAGYEKVRNSKQSKKATGGKKVITKISDMQWSQQLPGKVKELAEKAAAEGMSQKRSGAGGSSGWWWKRRSRATGTSPWNSRGGGRELLGHPLKNN